MKTSSLFLPFAFLFVTACGGTPTSTPPPAEKSGDKPTDGHAHGKEQSLGNLTIGVHTFELVQLGEVKAGAEAVIDLKFPAGKPLPPIVRAWVGIESAAGSIKDRIGKNGEGDGFHGHIEAPTPLPEGSKLWIEIEENGTKTHASVAWK